MGYEETTEEDERCAADHAYALVQLSAEGLHSLVGEYSEDGEPYEVAGPVDDDEGYDAGETEG